jgi:hypothetical protein
MILRTFLATILLLTGISDKLNAQGCSDAGFCTINSFMPEADSSSASVNQIKAGISYGKADRSISVIGTYLEFNRQLNQETGISVRLTSLAQNGNDISMFAASDIYLTGNFQATEKIKITGGVKIPLRDGNASINNLPLPMDYQSSLGTFDIIGGISYEFHRIQLSVAAQIPLTQNKNEFFAEDYPENNPLRNFQTTNQFERSGDVLLRISYPIKISQKLSFTPALLPIYHLTDDKFTNRNGQKIAIKGSEGLTLNGNAFFDYFITKKHAVQLNFAAPFVVRDSRPDGLTRSFIANLEYSFNF